ncbi:hypothetical protein ICF92_003249 [Escherichia coli]|nr:hypothetical protein [Escherichia coli]
MEMARQLLASMKQEPVAWMHRNGVSLMWAGDLDAKFKAKKGGWSPLYAAPQLPQPSVPDEMTPSRIQDMALFDGHQLDDDEANAAADGWNACRGAMLQGNHRDLSYPVDPQVAAYEKIMEQAMLDGWVAVPVEPTPEMLNAWLSEIANWRGHVAGYKAMLAAVPQQEGSSDAE